MVTAQTTWAVSLEEAKSQLRVDTSDEDTLVEDLIKVAQRQVEEFTGLDLTAATYDFYLTNMPAGGIVLPKCPVATLTSIKYYDTTNMEQTWAATNYAYSVYERPMSVYYTDTVSIPSLYPNRFDAVTVRFTTGWTSPETLPAPLKQAVLIVLTDLYENRADTTRERFSNWQGLCYPFRTFHPVTENQ